MKKEAYFQKLSRLIRKLPEEDRETILAFYREIVEDKIESGIPEEEAVASLGSVNLLARKILAENPQRRSSGAKPLLIALGATLGVLLLLWGGLTAAGVISYRSFTAHEEISSERVDPPDSVVPSSAPPAGQDGEALPVPSDASVQGKHTEEYRIPLAEADKVEIEAENKSITFAVGEGTEIVILYDTDETQLYTVKQEARELKLENKDRRPRGSFNRDNPEAYRITVQVPPEYSGKLDAEVGNGMVQAEGMENLMEFSCDADNAEIGLSKIKAQRVELDTANGKLELRDVQAFEKIEIETDNGAIYLEDCNAPQLKMESDNGAVELDSVQATQLLQVESSNGAVSFDALESPDIRIKTDIGAVEGSIRGSEADYQVIASKTLGLSNLHNKSTGTKKLQVTTDIGVVHVTFDA